MTTEVAPKKKTKGKAATKESSIVGESRAAEGHSEVNGFVLLILIQPVLKRCRFHFIGWWHGEPIWRHRGNFHFFRLKFFSPKPARRICRKVPMSHPDAHLDPNLLLKKASYTPKRHTRSHSADLMSGLPERRTGRKRQSEVCFREYLFLLV